MALTYLQELMSLVPPPEAPTGAGSPDLWPEVEQRLGSPLPQDYKTLINCYGVGWFADWFIVFSPFDEPWNLFSWQERILSMYRNSQREWPQYSPPFPAFPDPGGLLPWGQSDDSDVFGWLTQGDPDDWPVVNLDNHYSENGYCIIETSVTGVLAGWFAGRITGDWYPEDVNPVGRRVFRQGQPADIN